MKILSEKKKEALFDDLMILSLVVSESTKKMMMGERPDIKDLIRQQRIIIERSCDVAYILKGMFGIKLAQAIHVKYDEGRLRKELKLEAKKDNLDHESEKGGEE